MKKLLLMAAILSNAILAGCQDDAVVASKNLSKAADNFEIIRNTVFYNTWTDTEVVSITGLCSIDASTTKLAIICKEGRGKFKKHFLGRTANMTYFSVQVEAADVSTFHTRIVWKPQSFIPDIDLKADAGELTTNNN